MQQLEIRQTNFAKAAVNPVPEERIPEAQYSYYRRCQLFRRNGEQCKAPAEKGAQICHAHAAQHAMALRREIERGVVLAEAVAEMRRQGRPECEMADLFTDFKGIQVTLAVTARALIAGRIDCKTSGRLLVHLQTMSKLLWMVHRKKASTTEARRLGEQQGLPQISADELRSETVEGLPKTVDVSLNLSSVESVLRVTQMALTPTIGRDAGGEDSRDAVETKILSFTQDRRGCRDGLWQQTRAA
jgi:hypothetical protein